MLAMDEGGVSKRGDKREICDRSRVKSRCYIETRSGGDNKGIKDRVRWEHPVSRQHCQGDARWRPGAGDVYISLWSDQG